MAQSANNLACLCDVTSSIPGQVQWVKDPVSCGVGRRCSSYLALLWLWCRLAATALIGPLAWEPPYGTGGALEKARKRKRKKKKKLLHRNDGKHILWESI